MKLPQPTLRRDWRLKLIEATHDINAPPGKRRTIEGCIVLAAISKQPKLPPYFVGKAIIANNGDVYCDYIDSDGAYHIKARIGDDEDFTRNLVMLTVHADLNAEERIEFLALVNNWIARDERDPSRIKKVMRV